MERYSGRRLILERLASLILAMLALIPLVPAAAMFAMIAGSSGACEEVCVIVGVVGALLVVATLIGLALAACIWERTRLGPLVGLGVSVAGVAWAASEMTSLRELGLGPGDDRTQQLAAIAIAFATAALLLALSVLRWARRAWSMRA